MKTRFTCLSAALVAFTLSHSLAADWTAGMKEGAPAFKTMGPLTFGPDGILFIGDSKSASVTAVATGDTEKAGDAKALKVDGINVKIAGLLGASADQLLIDDLAVNPLSRNAYLAVSRGRGPEAIPVLVRVSTDGTPEVVSMEKVKYASPSFRIVCSLRDSRMKSSPRPFVRFRFLSRMSRVALRWRSFTEPTDGLRPVLLFAPLSHLTLAMSLICSLPTPARLWCSFP